MLTAVETCGISCTGTILALTATRIAFISSARRTASSSRSSIGRHVGERRRDPRGARVRARASGTGNSGRAAAALQGRTLHETTAIALPCIERRAGVGPSSERTTSGLDGAVPRAHSLGRRDPTDSLPGRRWRERRSAQRSVKELLDERVDARTFGGKLSSIATDVLRRSRTHFEEVGDYRVLRIHGDCHRGNVLWTDDGPHFVDLDDCVNGPAVQDLWLFLSGTREEMRSTARRHPRRLRQFHEFDYRELRLIEALRTLRIIHYTAWITRRWGTRRSRARFRGSRRTATGRSTCTRSASSAPRSTSRPLPARVILGSMIGPAWACRRHRPTRPRPADSTAEKNDGERFARQGFHPARHPGEGHRQREIRRGLSGPKAWLYASCSRAPRRTRAIATSTPARRLRCRACSACSRATRLRRFRSRRTRFLRTSPSSSASRFSLLPPRPRRSPQTLSRRSKYEYEELPFTVDPLAEPVPGGPNARTNGNVVKPRHDQRLQVDRAGFRCGGGGSAADGHAATEWSYGDIDAGFAAAKLVLDETFVTAGLSHHSMEPRTAMAYWQNGKCYLHASSQSESFPVPTVARYHRHRRPRARLHRRVLRRRVRLEGRRLSDRRGARAHVEEDQHRPVMMRIAATRSSQSAPRAPGFQGRIKIGFRADGRITAIDLYIVQENGPNTGFDDWLSAADAVSLVYTPPAMRFRGVPVLTNTPPRGPQRGPGQNQIAAAVEPLIDKAARQLEARSRCDSAHQRARQRHEIRRAARAASRARISRDALDRGARALRLERAARAQRPAQRLEGDGGRRGHRLSLGRRQRLRRPRADHARRQDPHSYRRRQPRHLLAHGHVARRGGDAESELGELRRRARRQQQAPAVEPRPVRQQHVVHDDAHELCRRHRRRREAQRDRGYGSRRRARRLRHRREKVFAKADPSKSLTYAAAAQRAIELGGKFDGHEVPEDMNAMTKAVGRGPRGHAGSSASRRTTCRAPARCRRSRQASSRSSSTSKPASTTSSTTSALPTAARSSTRRASTTQIKSGAVMGIGLAASERHIFDPQNGLPGNVGAAAVEAAVLPRRAQPR